MRFLLAVFCLVVAIIAQADNLYKLGQRKALSDIQPGDKIVIEAAAMKANAGKYLKGQPQVALYAESSFVYSAGLTQDAIWEVVATGNNDPTYTTKPTYYLRMLNGGYYLGYKTDGGVSNIRSLTTLQANAYPFTLLNTTEAKTTSGSSPNWDTNSVVFQATAKAVQLGNSPTASGNPMVWLWSPSSANAPIYCPWNVYDIELGESSETICQELQELLKVIEADTVNYSALGDYQAVSKYQTALAEAKAAAPDGSLSANTYADLLSRLKVAYAGLRQPEADLLDVVFNDDGSASDVSPMKHAITAVGKPQVAYNETYKCNVASFANTQGASASNFYKTALYSNNQEFINKLSDGHSLEAIFRTRQELKNYEAKYLSSHQSGGTGLMICKQSSGKNGGNEITFLPNVGGWKWATSGVVPEVDIFYHVVGVWNQDEGLAYIYVNGELQNTVGAAGSLTLPSAASQWVGIGADPSGSNGESGANWEIVTSRIYDQPLTDYQVALLYSELPQAEEPLVKNIEYMGGLTMTTGIKFPIKGKGFEEGDIIRLSLSGKTYELPLTIREGGCHFLVPNDFESGTYTMALIRGERTQSLGTCAFDIADTMPGGAAVIAHRGYWTKGAGTSQNSRESLRNAIELDVYGSETDVWITTDGHIMVNHDSSLGGVGIQSSSYAKVKDLKLSNGEPIPELSDFFDLMDEYPDSKTKLIIEIKYNSSTDVVAVANKVVAAVKARNMQDRVEYISYSLDACKQVAKADPDAWVAYLGTAPLPGPKDLYPYGIMGLDYQTSQFEQNPTFIPEAKELGMTTNVYTVDTQAGILKITNMGINFVTTNYPEIAKRIYRLYEYNLPDPISEDEKARKELEKYIEEIDADTTDYSSSRFMPLSIEPFIQTLREARNAVKTAQSTAAEYIELQNALQQTRANICTYPKADAFDAVFTENGNVTDISPLAGNVVMKGLMETYICPAFDCRVAMLNTPNGTAPQVFSQTPYATTKSDGRLKEALMGGHALESVFRITQPMGKTRAYWFSAYNKGAVGLLNCSQSEGLNATSEISYILNVSPNGSTSQPILVPSGIEAKIDTFYHVVAVWDQTASKARIYVNGQQMNEVDAAGELHFSLSANYQWLCVGGTPTSTDAAGNGGAFDIVTARIYDQALKPMQVDYLWQQTAEGLGIANADPTGIMSTLQPSDTRAQTIWSPDGQRRTAIGKGINIVRQSDGTISKVLGK